MGIINKIIKYIMSNFIKGDSNILSVYNTDTAAYIPISCLTSNALAETRNIIESQTKCQALPEVLGPELILNGDFVDGSNWTLAGVVPPVISGGVCSFTFDNSSIRQSVLTGSKRVKITFDIVTTNNLGGFDIRDLSGTDPRITNGTEIGKKEVIRLSSGDGFRLSSIDGFDGEIDNVSIKEIIPGLNEGFAIIP